jgi:hypothetical protein
MGTSVIALSAVFAVLTAGFAYYYAAAEGQIAALNNQVSTLKENGHSFCLTVSAAVRNATDAGINIDEMLIQQIQSGRSMIATLNSTRPAGYDGMVAILNSEITHDQAIYGVLNPGSLPSPANPNTFCASVSKP